MIYRQTDSIKERWHDIQTELLRDNMIYGHIIKERWHDIWTNRLLRRDNNIQTDCRQHYIQTNCTKKEHDTQTNRQQ